MCGGGGGTTGLGRRRAEGAIGKAEGLAADIAAALAGDPAAAARWARLPPSHQREYLVWVEGAKKPETRQRRIAEMLTRLRADG
jgi:uncharacterized protein YdeI (YjbR/CyaY-like superfamily)